MQKSACLFTHKNKMKTDRKNWKSAIITFNKNHFFIIILFIQLKYIFSACPEEKFHSLTNHIDKKLLKYSIYILFKYKKCRTDLAREFSKIIMRWKRSILVVRSFCITNIRRIQSTNRFIEFPIILKNLHSKFYISYPSQRNFSYMLTTPITPSKAN